MHNKSTVILLTILLVFYSSFSAAVEVTILTVTNEMFQSLDQMMQAVQTRSYIQTMLTATPQITAVDI